MRHLSVAFAAITAIAVCVSSGAAVPAQAAFPGGIGRMAFDSGGNVYTVKADGTGLLQLTGDGQSGGPAWSPSGKRIAFSRRGFIFVMHANGRFPRKVERLGHSTQPAWSPDGKRLVFVHAVMAAPAGAQQDLWTVPSAGGTPTRLTHDFPTGHTACDSRVGGDGDPVWSPRGDIIAFDQCQQEIVVLHLKTSARTVIPQAWNPDFTADGRGLVFASELDPDDGPGSSFNGPMYESSNLTGGSRFFYSRTWCAEGAPCIDQGTVAAAPTSTLANPQGVYVETFAPKDDGSFGGFCVQSADAVDAPPETGRVDAGFCHFPPDSFPFVNDLDWQPLH